ncbi:MAG: hypothetical protein OXG59_00700 [Gammaproteobacteria bacterium]|nr:hypothetical protein [Gammaproteobacteria bacterium]MXZ26945.1 hypothetical protein [Gammaproteobacteria bacterium]MYF59333.1 hypothetical protein [Gammaproteobacteria bacterium]
MRRLTLTLFAVALLANAGLADEDADARAKAIQDCIAKGGSIADCMNVNVMEGEIPEKEKPSDLSAREADCARYTERLGRVLADDENRAEFMAEAVGWEPGDRPLDVRRWVDDARLRQRIEFYCESPELSLLVSIGGGYRLVDVTLSPLASERNRGEPVVIIEDVPDE